MTSPTLNTKIIVAGLAANDPIYLFVDAQALAA